MDGQRRNQIPTPDRYGAAVTAPSANDLSRAGYAFGGWYTDKSCSSENEFTAATMPAENTTLYAKWNAGQVNYTVNYYLQNVDGTTYPDTPSETVTGSDETGQTVDVQKSYEGFTPKSDTPSSITLQADSAQNVVNLYYTRNRYILSFSLGDGVSLDEGSAPTGGDTYYGAEISVGMSNVKRTGYTFAGWYEDVEYHNSVERDDHACP
ncbi:MAG: InlB B-repeat-containing protein [Oscillospiraceae bacterium]